MANIKRERSKTLGLLRIAKRLKREAFCPFYLQDAISIAGFSLKGDPLAASWALDEFLQISQLIEFFAA